MWSDRLVACVPSLNSTSALLGDCLIDLAVVADPGRLKKTAVHGLAAMQALLICLPGRCGPACAARACGAGAPASVIVNPSPLRRTRWPAGAQARLSLPSQRGCAAGSKTARRPV